MHGIAKQDRDSSAVEALSEVTWSRCGRHPKADTHQSSTQRMLNHFRESCRMARIPVPKMSYPCSECSFEAQSARQLSRHKAVTHVENALKCVLCPFVTAYQTNLLRHRREVHGICGSKGNKSCKFCGFLSEDNETLIRHQLEVHRDILKSAQVKFAKELVSAGGEESTTDGNAYASKYEQNYDLNERQLNASRIEEEVNSANRSQEEDDDDEDDDKNFWKEGFMDDSPNLFMNLASLQNASRDQLEANNWYVSSGQVSPASHENSVSDLVSSSGSTPRVSKKKMAAPASVGSNDDLPATRIRRQYTCNDCGFRTINPREFLYHRRDAHGQRLKIVECPYCVYACQYVQKLQRHLLLVHKLETSMTPPPELSGSSPKSSKPKAVSQNKLRVTPKIEPLEPVADSTAPPPPPLQHNVVPKIRVKLPTLTSPAMVTTSHVNHTIPGPPRAKLMSQQKSVSDQKRKIALQRQISANQRRMSDQKSIFAKKYHKCQTCGDKGNGEAPQPVDSFEADPNPTDDIVKQEINSTVEEEGEVDGESLGHLFTQSMEEGGSQTSPIAAAARMQTTFVRQTDGKIVAKQGSLKKCKYCNFQTETFAKLQKHESAYHPEKKFQCPLCEIKFENLVWLQRHLTHMHQEDSQTSNIVTILEQLNPKRKRNKPIPSTSTPLAQSVAEVLTEGLSKVQNNQSKRKQEQEDKNPTQCQVCGYQTRWISELEKHMRVHTKERPFSCPYCSFKSKWKGDLNRHIQKYHSRLPMPDLNLMEQQIQSQTDGNHSLDNSIDWNQKLIQEFSHEMSGDYDNDASILSGEADYDDYNEEMEEIKMDDTPLPDDYEERPLVFDDLSDDNEDNDEHNNGDETGAQLGDEDDNENELQIDFDDREVSTPTENTANTHESNPEVTKSGKVKMYRCSYCDFTCSTASRFHVHFVQHLNTKPFQCSVCGHRSNWEWDVTKHIKMKSQRDPKHAEAKAMLVHESGKRDYSKYNKYVVWVNQKEVIANNTSNPKIDFRAKRARLEPNDGIEYEDNDTNNQTNEVECEDDNSYNCPDPESIVITPDICFEVQGEEDDESNANMEYNQGFNPSFQPNVPYNSNPSVNSTPEDTKQLQCSYCEFKHKESKVMVSHLSSHAGMKPYRCRRCGFDSNWREVVVRHCVARHQSNSEDVEQRFRCTVNKTMCKIIDDNIAPKMMSASTSHLPSAVQAFQESHQSVRISGFKGSFRCDLCPFRAEKAFHMDFHVKRHQPSSGPFKCPHCPYWVNAKKSLVKHMLLHADNENEANNEDNNKDPNSPMADTGMDSFNENNSQIDDENDSESELVIYEGEDNGNQAYLNQRNQNQMARQSASVSKNRCDKCPFIAGTKTQLLYHKQFHRPNRNSSYSCTLCTYSVSYLHLLNQHMKVHYQNGDDTQEPINYCEIPADGEAEQMDDSDDRDESDIPFTWVQIGNNRRKLFQCRFCSTTSKRRTYIFVHERLHSHNTNETFKCSYCEFETRDSNHFLYHLNQHKTKAIEAQKSSIEPIAATDETTPPTPSVSVIDVNNIRQGNCPAAFKSPGDLKIHTSFHETDYPHRCPYCNYKAKNKPQLCKHLYVHTTEYISKRANSYPSGTKHLVGDAVLHMKRDLKSPPNDNSLEIEPHFVDPLVSSESVVNSAKDVWIKEEGIEKMAQMLLLLKHEIESKKYGTSVWREHPLHPKVADQKTIDWIFVIDSLNFSFWPNPNEDYTIDGHTGYWALCAAINRAISKGIPITDPQFYGNINEKKFREIFATDNGIEMPLLLKRLEVLRESGRVLNEKFGSSFVNCLKESESKVTNLLPLIVNNFSSFRDQTIYRAQRVSFYKRAQILIADIWAAFEGQGFGYFHDIDVITMFADYSLKPKLIPKRVPQVLVYFDVIEYSQRLKDVLKDENHLFQSGDEFEVEIRAASIVAVHRISERIRSLDTKCSINSVIIDFYLWDFRRENSQLIEQKTPFHRIRDIYY
ncbi:unnamed protein product [Medioppia subpectinata]|uniref:Queuosine 5'-phosphate N-glycosylase/hydrolase n=1 Tax=Medioppia subpectinata TaxID=1979941 RepID=A0A7R9PUD4_9ACAR|nr:unnamed protein product [Medioppia subpectinata]CAG2101412.1 unnamed protein product [Medioppia subpectinata]